ncbi:MAG: LemA family protein [Phycisphaeraceae bacterium]|nr:MAG: LemA family protein [Phycisphaeraceae bacterium]
MGLPLLIALIVLFVVLLVFVIGMYNKLVRKRIDCDNGWSQIDVQLKRRYDLVPNLVETVKGYASHERETLDAVIKARSQAIDAGSVKEQAEAESFLSASLGRLFALSEAYPDLKANTNFLALQEELTSTENKIGFARQHYNDCVARYRTARESFPTNLVANAFNFEPRDYFELDVEAAREAPKVSFS